MQGTGLSPRTALHDLRANARPFAVLLYVAVALTVSEYIFWAGRFNVLFPQAARDYAPAWYYGSFDLAAQNGVAGRGPWWGVLLPQAWWSVGTFVVWVIIPLIATRLAGVREIGLSPRGLAGKIWIYGVSFLVMLPVVVWASTRAGFLQTYPFLKPWYSANWCWQLLLCFWLLYALQFVSVEVFFRGFVCFTLEKSFGFGAIAVMTVPYCMIHFHKPLMEALAAIGAGVVLGWLALKTRSIWGGVLLHIAVAFSMDLLALWRSSSFPTR